jgi:Helix-turn-helix domain
MRMVKSLADALANLDLAKEIATAEPQKATAPRLLSGARGAVNGRDAFRAAPNRDEISSESRSPSQGRGGFEAYREHWQRQFCADRDLLPSAKVVLCVLWLYLNRETRTAWPSLRTLAKDTGMAPSSIDRLVRIAEKRGHLQITHGDSHSRTANTYTPILKQPEGLSDLDGTVPTPEARGLSRLDGTPCPIQTGQTVPHWGTEPLNEPLNEPLKEPKGEFEEEDASVARQANHEHSSRREPPSLCPKVGER